MNYKKQIPLENIKRLAELNKEYINIKEATHYLNCSRYTVYRHINKNNLRIKRKKGLKRGIFIEKDSIFEYLQKIL